MILGLIASVAVVTQAEVTHTFRYVANPLTKKVSLAGSFNGWNKTANPMKAEGNTWSLALKLKPGKYG